MSRLDPVAQFMDIRKTYREASPRARPLVALGGVSFEVGRGEVFALLGPNRAGKTTLVKILLGLCRPGGGQVRRLGRPPSDRSTLARVGYLHGGQAFPAYLTATRLLESYGMYSGVPRHALRERVPAWLRRVGLADRAAEPIARFSRGMLQRLALAQALLAEPDLLVLDEPTEGLDLEARETLAEAIDDQRHAGKSTLIVSHALEEVARVADRAAVLVAGRLAYVGTLDALKLDPETGRERSLDEALTPLYRGIDQGVQG